MGDEGTGVRRPAQKVVYIRADAGSYLLHGDELHSDGQYDGDALPRLLREGWSIDSVQPLHPISEEGNEMQALVLLTNTSR